MKEGKKRRRKGMQGEKNNIYKYQPSYPGTPTEMLSAE